MRAFAFALLLVLAGCGGPPDVESLGWLSMGTTAQLSFKTAEGPCAANERFAFGKVKEVFEQVERKLSIWRSDSEISRYVSLASLAAALALPVSAWLLKIFAGINLPLPVGILLILFALLAFWRHSSNIVRLMNGTENRFDKNKQKES